MKKIYIVSTILVLVVSASVAWGQTTIFTETMGTVGATTTIAAHAAANGFSNSPTFSYSQGSATNPGDIRQTSVSSGYAGASGGANVWLTSTSGEYGFAVEGINASGYTSLNVQFAYRKESGTSLPTLALSYWDGSAYVNVSFTFDQAANAATGWYLSPVINLPAAAQINGLRLRWVKTGTVAVRIDDVVLKGTPGPAISVSTSSLSFGPVANGQTSSEQSYTVSGSNLTANISISAPSDFEISTTSGSGFGSSLSLIPSDGTVSSTPIYVRFAPSTTGPASGNITHNSTGATEKTVSVSGTGIAAQPTTAATGLSFSSVGSSSMMLNWTSGNGADRLVLGKSGSAVDSNPSDGTGYTANSAFGSGTQVGTGNFVVYGGSGNSVTVTGLSSSTTYHFAVYEYNGSGSTANYLTTSPATGSQATTAPASPTISLTGSLSSFGSVAVGSTSSEQSYSVSGTALTADISISAPAGFQISTTSGSGFGSSVTLIHEGGEVASTPIYVRFTPSSTGSASGNITHTSAGVTTQNQAVTGFGIETEPTVQASSLLFSSVGSTSMTVSWINGNGSSRIVLARSGGAVNANPADGTSYAANAAFGSGTQVGSGNYVVYSGTGTSVTVTSLTVSTTYHFAVYEFNGSAGTENYLTSTPAVGNQQTSAPTYTWNQTGSAAWATAGNWTPDRSSPSVSDILLLDNGATVTVTGVPTQTIGKLVVANGTTVNLQASGTNTLTIAGGSGTDLDVAAGSALNIEGGNALTLFVGAGATGTVSGTMAFSGAAHKLNANDASAITFATGSSLTQGPSCTGNIFTNTGTASVVVFASGSTFIQQAGSNPFALSQPSSKVVFQAGSLFRIEQNAAPSFSGRTYANLEVNLASFSQSATGSNPLTIENLTITAGTLNLGMTGTFNLTGNVSVASGATLNFNPASAATVSFNGTSAQTFSGGGTITIGSNQNVTISNATGASLNRDLGCGGTLTLANGVFSVGANTLTLSGGLALSGGTLNAGSTSNLVVGGTAAALSLPSFTFNNVTVNRPSGVTLTGDLTVLGTLTVTAGKLVTSSNSVTLGPSATITGEATGAYVEGTLLVTRNVGAGANSFSGIGMLIAPGSGTAGDVSVRRTSGASGIVTIGSRTGIARKWRITPTSSVVRNITFSWVSDDDNGKDVSSVQVWWNDASSEVASWQTVGSSQSITGRTVTVSGVNLDAGKPYEFTILEGTVINVSTFAIPEFQTVGYAPSAEQSYTVAGNNLLGDVAITAPDGFRISLTSGTGFASSLTFSPTLGSLAVTTIYVRFEPSALASQSGNITHTSPGAASKLVALQGRVLAPDIAVSVPAALSFGRVLLGSPSSVRSYEVSGQDLVGPLTIIAPTNFQVSLSGTDGFKSTLALPESGGSVPSTPIFVRFNPTSLGAKTAKIMHTSVAAAVVEVPVTGTGVESLITEPTLQASGVVISDLKANTMKVSWTKGDGEGRLVLAKLGSAVDASPVDLYHYTAVAEFSKGSQIGTGNYVVYSGNDSVVTVTGLSPGKTYHVAVFEYSGSGEETNYLTTSPARGNATTPEILLTEDFDYPAGTLLTAAGWANHSGTTNFIPVVSPGLTFSGYPSSGIGNAAGLTVTGEDVNRTFTTQASGSVYAAFMVNVSASQTGDYFVHLSTGPLSSTYYRARVYAKDDGSGNLQFGLGFGAGTAKYSLATYPYNRTHLLVLKYTIQAGDNNDVVSLFVLPSIPTAEPGAADLIDTDPSTSDPTNIGSFAIRQGSTALSATLMIDGIRIATSWNMLFEGEAPTRPTIVAAPMALSFGSVAVASVSPAQSYSLSGSNLTGTVSVSVTSDFEISTSATSGFGSSLTLSGVSGTLASTPIFVRFAPTSAGAKSGIITHTTAGGDTVRISLSGTGTTLAYSFSSRSLNFGSVVVNGTKTDSVRVSNTGTSPITFSSISCTNAEFSVSPGGATIDSGKSTLFTVSFRPTSAGAKSGFIVFAGTGATPDSVAVSGTGTPIVSSIEGPEGIPTQFALRQNYPNPFNPSTVIRFEIMTTVEMSLTIYDVLGREVAVLVDGVRAAGIFHATWNANDLPTGIYLLRMVAGDFVETRKVVLAK